MEWLTSAGAVLAGFLLRLAIPVGITTLLAWLLRRLDARWQREAEQQRMRNIALTSVPSPQIWGEEGKGGEGLRCWQVRNCPLALRDVCPAYAHPEIPCWQAFRNGGGQLKEECLDCDIFRQAPVPLAV